MIKDATARTIGRCEQAPPRVLRKAGDVQIDAAGRMSYGKVWKDPEKVSLSPRVRGAVSGEEGEGKKS